MVAKGSLLLFQPRQAIFPSSDYAYFFVRNSHYVLVFSGSTNKSIYFEGVLPQQYSGTGVDIILYFCTAGSTSGTVTFNVSFERIGEILDIDGDSFATAQSGSNSSLSSTDGAINSITVTLTDGAQMDALLAGEAFRIKVERDATDSHTGNIHLLMVEMREKGS